MSGWIKTLTVSMCILTILMHVIPNGKFTKYVKFYAGLLFFLLAADPLLELFGKSGDLERLWQLEFLKEEYYDMETAVEGMADLKNEEIKTRYQQEILRQIKEIAAAYNLAVSSVKAQFGEEEGYRMTWIDVVIAQEVDEAKMNEEQINAVRQELSEVYSLAKEKIQVRKSGDGKL